MSNIVKIGPIHGGGEVYNRNDYLFLIQVT